METVQVNDMYKKAVEEYRNRGYIKNLEFDKSGCNAFVSFSFYDSKQHKNSSVTFLTERAFEHQNLSEFLYEKALVFIKRLNYSK